MIFFGKPLILLCIFGFLMLADSALMKPDEIYTIPPFIYSQECPESCGVGISLEQGLVNLYKVYPLTETLKKFRDAVLSLLDCVSFSQLSVLVAQSLYAVDIISGYNPGLPISCILNKFIKATYEKENNAEAYELAKANYMTYSFAFANNSIRIGLMTAGCCYPEAPKVGPFNECDIEPCVFEFLEQHIDLPPKLKRVILELLKSKNKFDNLVGLNAIATATEDMTLWSKLINTSPVYTELLKWKSCGVKIPKQCCFKREFALIKLVEDLNVVMNRALKIVISGRKYT